MAAVNANGISVELIRTGHFDSSVVSVKWRFVSVEQ